MHGLFEYFRPLYENEPLDESEVIRRFARGSRIAVLTGAGVSAESNIPTFRGKGGIWDSIDMDEVATAEALGRDLAKVWRWLDELREVIAKSVPNRAHRVLVEMERTFDHFSVITQNIDGLHQSAGSGDVVEIHGNIWRVRCMEEGTISYYTTIPAEAYPPRCACGATMRPDVVFFHEPLPRTPLERAMRLAAQCDLMLVIGTSAVVQPAASLPVLAAENDATILEFNLEQTPVSPMAHFSSFGPAGETLDRFWERLMAQFDANGQINNG